MSLFLFAFTLEKVAVRKSIEDSGKDIVPVGVVEGSFFAVRADAIRRVRGFDERTFLYAEEIILSFRLRAKGYLMGVLPGESGSDLAKRIFESLKERDIYVRYFPKPRIDGYLRISIGTDEEMHTFTEALKEIITR